jgi:hypothetical protein
VGQGQLGHGVDVGLGDDGAGLVGGQGGGRLVDRQVGAEAVGPLPGAAGAERLQDRLRHDHLGEQALGPGDLLAFEAIGGLPAGAEPGRVGLEGQAAADDLGAVGRVGHRLDLDGQAEAVEQLGAEVPLLRVHRADQDEAGRVAERQALALDVVDAHGGGVQEQVDQVVAQQVDLVDVEDAAVGRGQQPRLEGAGAGGQGALEVQAADDAVLGGADGQVDQGDGPAQAAGPLGQGPAGDVFAGGAGERVPLEDVEGRQQRGQRADGRALGGPLRPPDQDPAQPGWIAARIRARFIASWPTRAENGKIASPTMLSSPFLAAGAAGIDLEPVVQIVVPAAPPGPGAGRQVGRDEGRAPTAPPGGRGPARAPGRSPGSARPAR